MLHLQIDPKGATPAYRQLMDQVKYYVASGTLRAGDQLPSIREAARYLTVNPSTVVRAWGELEHQGVIEKRHGKGVFVSADTRRLTKRECTERLRPAARRLAVEARQLGTDDELVLDTLREELEHLRRSDTVTEREPDDEAQDL